MLTLGLVLVVLLFVGCTGSNPVVLPPDAGAGSDAALVDGATADGPVDTGIPAPTNVIAVRGDGVVTVSWTPPPVDVIWYAVASIPAGASVKTNDTSAAFTGLSKGTKFRFTVVAMTARGDSLPSDPSNEIVPASLPGIPTNVVATGGNSAALVSWTAPSDNGAPITSYTVTTSPGGATTTAVGTSVNVIGVDNGLPYTFTVTATNAIGTGAPSTSSNVATPTPPPNAPDPPHDVSATAGSGAATIAWSVPNDKGLAISGYVVTSNPDGRKATTANTSADIGGLSNGVSYTFTVTATNSAGTSVPSTPSNAVIPTGPPGAPTTVTAVRGDKAATVTWTAPNNGGVAITGYTVTAAPGGQTASVAGTTAIVTGLTNGTSYKFTVTATNPLGTGPASTPSNSVVPASAPGIPTGVSATPGNTSAVVSWTPPPDNGSLIVSYKISSSPGGITATGFGTSATIGGLTNGVTYTFTVTATNSVGTGPASVATNSVTPAVCAQTTYTVTNPGNGYVFSGVVGTNPVVTVCRGLTYTFHLQNVFGHPFAVLNGAMVSHPNVTNNGAQGNTDIVWTVSPTEPAGPRYVCLLHPPMTNAFDVR